jgi:hypothetical protein
MKSCLTAIIAIVIGSLVLGGLDLIETESPPAIECEIADERLTEMPNLLGLKESEVKNVLNNTADLLGCLRIATEENKIFKWSDGPNIFSGGKVISQWPSPGELIQPDQCLWVSTTASFQTEDFDQGWFVNELNENSYFQCDINRNIETVRLLDSRSYRQSPNWPTSWGFDLGDLEFSRITKVLEIRVNVKNPRSRSHYCIGIDLNRTTGFFSSKHETGNQDKWIGCTLQQVATGELVGTIFVGFKNEGCYDYLAWEDCDEFFNSLKNGRDFYPELFAVPSDFALNQAVDWWNGDKFANE